MAEQAPWTDLCVSRKQGVWKGEINALPAGCGLGAGVVAAVEVAQALTCDLRVDLRR